MTVVESEPGQAGVQRAMSWSLLNSISLRIANFLAGIVVARLVAPQDFGIFAVALTVQTVLAAFADLGLGADLIRNGRIRERAGTATTVALAATGVIAAMMVVTAGPVSAALGSREAAPIVRVMALTIVLNGLALVPGSILQREFRQKALFGIGTVTVVLTNAITIGLVMLGMGAMSLAVARVVAQAVDCTLQHVLTRVRPTLAFDRAVAVSVLRFGVPVAGANLISWLVMTVDYMVVGSVAGALALGYYLLAFNISSWPMSALGQAIRAVALPAFSRLTGRRRVDSLVSAVALAWAVALLVGAVLATLSYSVIVFVYGERWAPAAAALAGLAYFGAARVVIDLMTSFQVAAGKTRAVLLVQVAWLVGLIPTMFLATRQYGLAGAGWAHVVATVLFAVPASVVALRAAGADVSRLIAPLAVPFLAAVPAVLVTRLAVALVHDRPLAAILLGGSAGLVVYVAVLLPWARGRYRQLREVGRQRVDSEIEVAASPA